MTSPKLLTNFLLVLIFHRAQADNLARYCHADSLIHAGSSGIDDLRNAFASSEAGSIWNLPRFDGIRGLITNLLTSTSSCWYRVCFLRRSMTQLAKGNLT
ncbi:MAG TPA: hypothetical protein EYO59_10365 [Chromatiaceae bacterium]|nr:hypothetical protein [Chromatiaceae bacterium]